MPKIKKAFDKPTEVYNGLIIKEANKDPKAKDIIIMPEARPGRSGNHFTTV
jgi:hypothetical protein